MADVVHLRPELVAPLPDPYRELQRQRTLLIGAWTAWLATAPPAEDIRQEIAGTSGAMEGLASIIAGLPSRERP